jgi:hypothetical protein
MSTSNLNKQARPRGVVKEKTRNDADEMQGNGRKFVVRIVMMHGT